MSSVFTDTDYNSDSGMVTYTWGPSLWHSLHTISFNYPVKPTPEQQEHYYNFFLGLANILPCKYCRDNFKNNLIKLPLTKTVLKNRYNFSKWLYNFHELVNTNLGKHSNLTYEDVRDRYENFRARCLVDPKIKTKIEKGCTEPLYGVKSKCTINIVPKNSKIETFKINNKCKVTKKVSKKKE